MKRGCVFSNVHAMGGSTPGGPRPCTHVRMPAPVCPHAPACARMCERTYERICLHPYAHPWAPMYAHLGHPGALTRAPTGAPWKGPPGQIAQKGIHKGTVHPVLPLSLPRNTRKPSRPLQGLANTHNPGQARPGLRLDPIGARPGVALARTLGPFRWTQTQKNPRA